MNILLNFIPLKQGGGVQVGLDFLSQAKLFGKEHNWYIVATEGTPFVDYEYSENIYLVKIIPNKIISRLVFEYLSCKQVIKKVNPEVIYTQFGPVWPGAKNKVNVAGCAYSNLMYPEIDFWSALPIHKKLYKHQIDYFRKRRMLSADIVIFETEDLANRASKQNNLSIKKVMYVRPSVSSLISHSAEHSETVKKCKHLPRGFKVLLLAGYHHNKNIEILPKIAYELVNAHKIDDVVFIMTLLKDQKKTIEILKEAESLGVGKNVYNFEPVPYEGCTQLYKSVNAVILPSRLESFSNNIAEAWEMEKPLIISEFDWSKSICGGAAIYVNFNDSKDAANKIASLYNNALMRSDYVQKGKAMLAAYPKSKERFFSYLKIIEKAALHN